LSWDRFREIIGECLLPAHFYERLPGRLSWQHYAHEEVAWEILQGRLLSAAQTRLSQTFESWNVYWHEEAVRSEEPVVSVKLSTREGQIHVTRAIYCYVWEGYHAGDNVYLSREVPKWVPELVGTIRLDQFSDHRALQHEIVGLLFHAIVGTSRLPLTSVESALPGFSLGEIGYFHRPGLDSAAPPTGPMRSAEQLVNGCFGEVQSATEQAKLIELLLRTPSFEQLEEVARCFANRGELLGWPRPWLIPLYRRMFNDVTLSPYTHFVINALRFLDILSTLGQVSQEENIDFLSYLLRQTARHLTAYDLFTFHHRGANYPDALLLDDVLRAYLDKLESVPDLFLQGEADKDSTVIHKRIRRRALRQGLLMWRIYQGLAVPDWPTSLGENARILPAPFCRVPEEQILDPRARSKRLFAGSHLGIDKPTVRSVISQSLADLKHPEEFQELGKAIYLDRPLGYSIPAGEPDQTPLLSYELFSRSLAEDRLRFLERELFGDTARISIDLGGMRPPNFGLPLRAGADGPRAGVVAIEDAAKIAKDFLILRTTRESARSFLDLFDFAGLRERFELAFLEPSQAMLIIRANAVDRREPTVILIFDAQLRRRLELEVDMSRGCQTRGGIQLPVAGLRVLRIWTTDAMSGELRECDLQHEEVVINAIRP
jgi:hypothetical protein